MIFESRIQNKQALFVVVGIVLVAGVAYFAWPKHVDAPSTNNPPQQVACTMEAKLCPDGSSVGRSGPKCEFAACPAGSVTDSWKTAVDSKSKLSFKYPETLATRYINLVDWPPKLQILAQPFTCTEAGSEASRSGKTTKQTIDGHEYCVTKETDGAAGSIYTQYAYAFPKGEKTAIFTFSLRFVQCGNYDEPQKTACETERSSFSMDQTVDLMAQSLK